MQLGHFSSGQPWRSCQPGQFQPRLGWRIPPWRRLVLAVCLVLSLVGCCWLGYSPSALAGLEDDRFDGNIFALYAGNGSLVPPKVTLAQAFQRQKPTLLVFYVNDSSDCKQFAAVLSQLQAPYGREADFIPVNVDALPVKASYSPSEPGYYYKGVVPQTVLFNRAGQVVLDVLGRASYEQIDDAFRQVFDLLPRSESPELKRRSVNEINVELAR